MTEQAQDIGRHYRYRYIRNLTADEIKTNKVVVKLDPYRICQVYGVRGGPREHIIKKALRGTGKGYSETELIDEIQCCLDRWKEMLQEDK